MLIETVVVGPLQVNCYIVACEETKQALVIDPGDDAQRILQLLAALKLKVTTIVDTHGHFDHVGGNRELVEATGADLLLHQEDLPILRRAREHAASYGLRSAGSPEPTRLLLGGETLAIGQLSVAVIATPGHSPGGIALHVGGHLFVGDTLFADSVGRTDLPGSSHAALVSSIRDKLFVFPDATVVHPGHGPDTTIGREKRHNPFVGDRAI
jgi:glyoxylase-like metal-dependent hydrolase (beta-lactamase superfamily II)